MGSAIKPIEGIIAGEERKVAVMLDEASGWAFGPLFKDAAELRRFLAVEHNKDPRLMDDEELEAALRSFRDQEGTAV